MRLINAKNLENYAYEPEFGIKDEMENWVDEINIPVDVKAEYEEELKGLCWKVLKSCMNVIRTEPTAYDVNKVVNQMAEYIKESSNVDYNRAMIEAIEIVKSGGIG